VAKSIGRHGRKSSEWLREIAPDAPLGAQVHSCAMAHPLLFFSSSLPLFVGKYCFVHLELKAFTLLLFKLHHLYRDGPYGLLGDEFAIVLDAFRERDKML
jgi:hypothetical protein